METSVSENPTPVKITTHILNLQNISLSSIYIGNDSKYLSLCCKLLGYHRLHHLSKCVCGTNETQCLSLKWRSVLEIHLKLRGKSSWYRFVPRMSHLLHVCDNTRPLYYNQCSSFDDYNESAPIGQRTADVRDSVARAVGSMDGDARRCSLFVSRRVDGVFERAPLFSANA